MNKIGRKSFEKLVNLEHFQRRVFTDHSQILIFGEKATNLFCLSYQSHQPNKNPYKVFYKFLIIKKQYLNISRQANVVIKSNLIIIYSFAYRRQTLQTKHLLQLRDLNTFIVAKNLTFYHITLHYVYQGKTKVFLRLKYWIKIHCHVERRT